MATESVILCNVNDMMKNKCILPDFILYGTHFGRGDHYVNDYSKEIYKYRVLELKCWKVNVNLLTNVESEILGNFYASSNYVVYVKYQANIFDLNTGDQHAKESAVHDVCFYWRGINGPQISPLPKELEVMNPPVERIVQWSELPIFVRLFQGTMMVHTHEVLEQNSRLYILRGTLASEVHLIEIPNKKCNLRSRTSFLLILPTDGKMFIWHGSKSDNLNKVFLKKVVTQLQENKLTIYGTTDKYSDITVVELHENMNNDEFENALEGGIHDYYSLRDKIHLYNFTPKLFYFNSISGSLSATEVLDTLASENTNPFPFLQNHLYSATQPALFLVDNFHELWLWQGWIPDEYGDTDIAKFMIERDLSIKTAIQYSNKKYTENGRKIYLVEAGSEPIEFTNIFPYWVKKQGLNKCATISSEYAKQTILSLKYLL